MRPRYPRGYGRMPASRRASVGPAMRSTTDEPASPGRRPAPTPDPSHFRHSYSKDKTQLVRRLSRMEGQVRGIARMIEREEYCVDILQQTAALRAAVDALSILVLEDHVQGCVRTAAEARRGRRVRRRGHRRRPAHAGPAGPRRRPLELGHSTARPGPRLIHEFPRRCRQFVDNPVDAAAAAAYRPASALGQPRVTRSARGTGRPGHEPDGRRKTGITLAGAKR